MEKFLFFIWFQIYSTLDASVVGGHMVISVGFVKLLHFDCS